MKNLRAFVETSLNKVCRQAYERQQSTSELVVFFKIESPLISECYGRLEDTSYVAKAAYHTHGMTLQRTGVS